MREEILAPCTDNAFCVELPFFIHNIVDNLDTFKQNLVTGGSTWYDVPGEEAALYLIRDLHPEVNVICSAAPGITGNKDINSVALPHDLDDVDVGIIRAGFGVAENGMVWLREKDIIINALGFLSRHLIILLDPSKIVANLYEAYKRIELNQDNYGCFLQGPSVSIEAESTVVKGAQGARTITVFFMK